MLHVEIYTPERTVFKGEARGVQIPGISGLFEVLSGHAPLISSLTQGTIRLTDENNNTTSSYKVDGGFAEVLNNRVSILVDFVG